MPDVYGIYQFRVIYKREAVTSIKMSDKIALRPFKHNEYERFIVSGAKFSFFCFQFDFFLFLFSAYPYYSSAFCMMIGFFVFSTIFFFTKEEKRVDQ